MYYSMNVMVKSGPVYDWCDITARKANNLYNAALFRIRQSMTACKKDHDTLSDNEKEVLDEIETMNRKLASSGKGIRKIPDSGFLSYTFLDDLMKLTDNPDYCCRELPKQSAQHVLKHACRDMQSFFSASSVFREAPSCFTGRPQLPHYKRKRGNSSFDITNQDCVIRQNSKGHYVAKLPKTKSVVSLGKKIPGVLKEVHVTPVNGIYQISFVFDDQKDAPKLVCEAPTRIAAIDFGVDNFMAVTNNCGLDCILYKGGVLKSANCLYNKKIAGIMSRQTKGSGDKFIPIDEYYSVLSMISCYKQESISSHGA